MPNLCSVILWATIVCSRCTGIWKVGFPASSSEVAVPAFPFMMAKSHSLPTSLMLTLLFAKRRFPPSKCFFICGDKPTILK